MRPQNPRHLGIFRRSHLDRFGQIDLVFNNAGVALSSTVEGVAWISPVNVTPTGSSSSSPDRPTASRRLAK